MRGVVFVATSVAVLALALPGGPGRASLYSPEDPMAIPVEDGKAVALPFEEFKRRMTELGNAMKEPQKGEKDSADRQKFLDRIADRKKAKKLSSDETAALATDLIRVGKSDEALDRLGAKLRPFNYWVLTTLGHVYAARGDWVDALNQQDAAVRDVGMPETVKGLTKAQRDWWEKLDRDYLPHYYRLNRQYMDSRRGLTPDQLEEANRTEEPTPLFPLPERGKPQSPVRFVNDAGVYEPGVLAASERAKLPPDALAIAQQLALWFPLDARLYWLVAELYAAEGNFKAAYAIFHDLGWNRRYGNRKVLMDHRTAVEQAIPKAAAPEDVPLVQPDQPAETPPPEEGAGPPLSMRAVLIYFGVIGLIGLLALVRALIRRGKAGCGPVG